VAVPKALFLCVEELSRRRYSRASDHWQVRPATAEEAGLLEVPIGSPVVHLIHNAADF
jgi:GntR family transcriptional regulator